MDEHLKICPLKTEVAEELVAKESIRWVSNDTIRNVMERVYCIWSEYTDEKVVFQNITAILCVVVVFLIFKLQFQASETETIKQMSALLQSKFNTKINANTLWPLYLDHFSEMSSCGDQVAPVIFRIHNFTAEKVNNDEQWQSAPFFAYERGCLMFVKVGIKVTYGYLLDSIPQLFFNLCVLKGPHDKPLQMGHLSLVEIGIFKIEILNQLDDFRHYTLRIEFEESNSDPSDEVNSNNNVSQTPCQTYYILYETINEYLKNDAFYFRISYEDSSTVSILNASKLTNYILYLILILLWGHVLGKPILFVWLSRYRNTRFIKMFLCCLVVQGCFETGNLLAGVIWAAVSYGAVCGCLESIEGIRYYFFSKEYYFFAVFCIGCIYTGPYAARYFIKEVFFMPWDIIPGWI